MTDMSFCSGPITPKNLEICRVAMREFFNEDPTNPKLFVIGRVAPRAGQEANHGTLALIGSIDDVPHMELLDSDTALRHQLSKCVFWQTQSKKPRRTDIPKEVIQDLIKYPDAKLPRLSSSIVRTPVIAADGRILDKPGYDAQAQLFCAPEVQIESIPEIPTDEDVRIAVETLRDPVDEFPFASESDFAGFLATAMTPIVRPLIHAGAGQRPISVFTASVQGSGKSKLAQVATEIGYGTWQTSNWPSEDEMSKHLTSLVNKGMELQVFDNLTKQVRSATLAAFTTSPTWSGRRLGTNQHVKGANNVQTFITMNGATLDKDFARRCLIVHLKPTMAHPEERTGFKYGNLIERVKECRANYIRAILILARSWITRDRVKDPSLRLGGFEGWCRVVGGILFNAGVLGLPGCFEAARSVDTETDEDRTFVAEWWDTAEEGEKMRPSELADIALSAQVYQRELRGATTPGAKGYAIADVLTRLKDQVFDIPYDSSRDDQRTRKVQVVFRGKKANARWFELVEIKPAKILSLSS